jgi:hypothetical protein
LTPMVQSITSEMVSAQLRELQALSKTSLILSFSTRNRPTSADCLYALNAAIFRTQEN